MVKMPDDWAVPERAQPKRYESTLQTERLVLRMFTAEDIEPYARICSDPEVMRFLSLTGPYSRIESWRHVAMILGHWQLRGYGLWAVEERATGALIGRIGFLRPDGWPGFELGWMLARSYWGRGFATEGARRALDYSFSVNGPERVISLIHPDNRASIRVAERLGERLSGQTELLGWRLLIYAIDRDAATRVAPSDVPTPA
ncbi:MAG TPA: GNAT family N-acetyltransferase [Gemmatimonadaceae bacterium]|nr:GNAT family N-acetyltransferase [Gemmatimonadaceae bacterium]